MKDYLVLLKLRISLSVTFSGVIGYILCYAEIELSFFLVIAGLFFLSTAASVLNQIQELKYDSIMSRTNQRPLVKGSIQIKSAWILFCVLFFFGILFSFLVNWCFLSLGVVNLLWYNFVYTPLKRKTAFAAIPGGITGALPVFMGWCGAGSTGFYPQVMFVACFIFLWQVPHFWLLFLYFGKDYEAAGYPSLLKVIPEKRIKQLIFVWMFATSTLSLFFPVLGIVKNLLFSFLLLIVNGLLIIEFTKLVRRNSDMSRLKRSFILTNIYLLLSLTFIFFDKILKN